MEHAQMKCIITAQLFLENSDELSREGMSLKVGTKVRGVLKDLERTFSGGYTMMAQADKTNALPMISNSLNGAVKALAELDPIQWEQARLALQEIKEKELA